ncbi:DNA polymerase III subunit gamma/tau [Thermodesulfobacterium sp. TA1]|uniref:DNA polymerase III subunit gamma/tau n=1 Tax=Thermodesulfobacterium sp. TA1 TaxID=2234087 RepID=UPI0012326E65|nr:DNA polymerase III subunit gamma/tau [Thermodesulfobacterium sp. TA1]QER42323.1 DNA polymerase III subunit gamma/tau [Thermodesulfobacterium sp. TA1]
MSYIVLARRYRPQSFKEVVGQTHVVKTIANALKLGKLSHALLFSGIKGTGKTTVARLVAKALNCLNPIEGYEPCNQCPNCLEINRGVFVDVIEIDAASNRGIDQIREIIENLKYAPTRGKAKVYIIDEAHMLTKEASNALLKSLEEPPSHVYFILATTEPNRLLPTILSRCQRYDFRKLDLPQLIKHLKTVCEKESYQIEEEALKLIAKEAQGSLRDALSLLDQAMAYGTHTKEDVIQAFGWHEALLIEELAQVLLEKNLKKTLEVVQKVYEQGTDLIYLMEKLTEFFRELFLTKALPQENTQHFQNPVLRDLVLEYELEEIFLILQSLTRDLEILRRSSYPQLQFELALVRVCEQAKLVPLNKLIEKIETLPNLSFDYKNLEPSLKETEEKKEPLTFSEKTWQDFLELLAKDRPILYSLANSLPSPVFNLQRLHIKVKEHLKNTTYFDELIEKMKEFFKKPVEVEVEVSPQPKLEEIKERPEVKEILTHLSAKISYIQILNKE